MNNSYVVVINIKTIPEKLLLFLQLLPTQSPLIYRINLSMNPEPSHSEGNGAGYCEPLSREKGQLSPPHFMS